MTRHIDSTGGMIFAEALSFALGETLPRPEAQVAVKAMVAEAISTNQSLATVAHKAHPNLDVDQIFNPEQQLGLAPNEALAFANAARSKI